MAAETLKNMATAAALVALAQKYIDEINGMLDKAIENIADVK